MTINSLSLIQSTPFTGLMTNTYNVPATGRYTAQVICTIPWLSSDAPSTVAQTREIQTVTTAADVAGSKNSTFWTFYTAGNLHGYYVWYNINSAGVDPAPAGLTGIEVDGATSATANTLATATRAAINASSAAAYVTASGATSAVIITNIQYGSNTAAADGTAATSFTFAVGTTGTYGSGSGLVVTINEQTTAQLVLSQPTPTQGSLSGSVAFASTAGHTITVVTSSLAAADAVANAVKGVINIYAGG